MRERGTSMERGLKFSEMCLGGRDVFIEDMSVKTECIVRVHVCVEEPARLSVKRMWQGKTVTEKLNSWEPLKKECAYIFDVMAKPGQSINLQLDRTTQVSYLQVDEMPLMVKAN